MADENPNVSGVAGRYATALFELARDEKSIDSVKEDLDKFDFLITESADLARLVRSPVFSAETQLSFKSWCQRARIAAAIEKLSTEAGVSVKQLASDLGYASVPAFSHAFRQVTGKTPTEFAGKE